MEQFSVKFVFYVKYTLNIPQCCVIHHSFLTHNAKLPAIPLALNPASAIQLQTFLFGGAQNERTKEVTERVRVFKVPREEIPEEALEAYQRRDGASNMEGWLFLFNGRFRWLRIELTLPFLTLY